MVAFAEALLQAPPAGVQLREVEPPAQITAVPVIALASGDVPIVTDVVYVAVQPIPVPLFTASVYTPLASVVADGTVAVADPEFVIVTGPLHEYPVTFATPDSERLSVVPVHIGPLVVMPSVDGAGLTVADVV